MATAADQTASEASAFLRSGTVFVQAYLPTTSGLSIASGSVYIASADDPRAIADAVRKALLLPRSIIDHPSQDKWLAVQKPMLEAAGVKSWKTLAKGSRAVGIVRERTELYLTPSANYEQSGGVALADQQIRTCLTSHDLGSELLEAFSRCE